MSFTILGPREMAANQTDSLASNSILPSREVRQATSQGDVCVCPECKDQDVPKALGAASQCLVQNIRKTVPEILTIKLRPEGGEELVREKWTEEGRAGRRDPQVTSRTQGELESGGLVTAYVWHSKTQMKVITAFHQTSERTKNTGCKSKTWHLVPALALLEQVSPQLWISISQLWRSTLKHLASDNGSHFIHSFGQHGPTPSYLASAVLEYGNTSLNKRKILALTQLAFGRSEDSSKYTKYIAKNE